MEEMQIGSRIDINVGELWNNLSSIFQNNRTMRRTVKLSAAMAHTNGQKVVAAESFTGEPESSKWQEHPFALKVLGDRMFTQGLNRMVFHRFAHQPHPTAETRYDDGTMGISLRQNEYVVGARRCVDDLICRDASIFCNRERSLPTWFTLPVKMPAFIPVWRDELKPSPPEGYDYDLVNAEVLLNKAKVVEGRLVLNSGVSYRVLVLQDYKTMSVRMLSKVKEFAEQGVVIVGERPLRSRD